MFKLSYLEWLYFSIFLQILLGLIINLALVLLNDDNIVIYVNGFLMIPLLINLYFVNDIKV